MKISQREFNDLWKQATTYVSKKTTNKEYAKLAITQHPNAVPRKRNKV